MEAILLLLLAFVVTNPNISAVKAMVLDFQQLRDLIQSDNLTAIEQLFKDGLNFSNNFPAYFDNQTQQFRTGWTPLHLALSSRAESVAKFVVSKVPSSLSVKNSVGETAIHLACLSGNIEISQKILNVNHQLIEIEQSDKRTPIFYAILSRNVGILQFLVENRADVHHVDAFGMQPLHFAVLNNNKPAWELLFQVAGDTLSHNESCWAAKLGDQIYGKELAARSISLISARCSYGNQYFGSPLHSAAFHGHPEYAELLLAIGANILARDSSGATIAHFLVRHDNFTGFLPILTPIARKHGGILETRDKKGRTPLMWSKSLLASKSLVEEFGVDVSAVDRLGYSALHLVPSRELVEYLATLLPEIDAKTFSFNSKLRVGGLTPLLVSVKAKKPIAIIEAFIKLNASKTATNDLQQNAVHIAVEENNVEVIDLLWENEFNFSERDVHDLTPLLLAFQRKNWKIVNRIIELARQRDGSQILTDRTLDSSSSTPLHLAVSNFANEVVENLLSHPSIDVSALNANHETALHMAILNENGEASKMLLGHDILLPIGDSNGRTPLHIAASMCSQHGLQIATQIIESNNDSLLPLFEAVDNRQLTPLDVAVFSNCYKMAELLISSDDLASCAKRNKEILTAQKRALIAKYELLLERLGKNDTYCPLDEQMTISCEEEGETPKDSSCCGSFPLIQNGFVTMETENENETPVALLKCDAGYEINGGNPVAKCMLGGEWNLEANCNKVHCVEAPFARFAEVAPGPSFRNANRTAKCRRGYFPTKGSITVLCRSDGEWHVDGSCEQTKVMPELFTAAEQGDAGDVLWVIAKGANINARRSDNYSALEVAAMNGHYEVVKALLEHDVDFQTKNINGTTPLMLACSRNNTAVVRLLLEHHVDVGAMNKDGWTALAIAVKLNLVELVQLLLENGAKVSSNTTAWRSVCRPPAGIRPHSLCSIWTVLTIAARQNNTKIVQLLLQHGGDINLRTKEGRTALMFASFINNTESVRRLLEHGAETDISDEQGWNALILATYGNHSEAVQLLLQYGADVDDANDDGWTALMMAARFHHIEAVEELLQHGANVDLENNNNWTALALATRHNHTEAVRLLLRHGANVNQSNSDSWTPLITAVRFNYSEITRLLLENGASVNVKQADGWTPLMLAAWYNNTEAVELLLQYGADVNLKDKEGWTALMLACQINHSKAVEKLLQHRADYNAAAAEGLTPLILAARYNHSEAVRLLLDHGAEQNHTNQNGWTALMSAARHNHTEAVRLLLQHGAEVNTFNHIGWTAIMQAARYNHTEAVKLLLQYGADANVQDKEGWTALMLACFANHTEAIRLLLQNSSVTVNARNSDGWTALMLVAGNNNSEVVELFLQHGADVNARDQDGLTALMVACHENRTEAVRLLLENGAEVNVTNNDGWTPLMIAAKFKRTEALRLLLQYGADVNAIQYDGWTAMMFACETGNFEAVKLLLQYRADVSKTDGEGWSALMLTARFNHADALGLLIGNGAAVDAKNSDGWNASMIAARFNHTAAFEMLTQRGNLTESRVGTPRIESRANISRG